MTRVTSAQQLKSVISNEYIKERGINLLQQKMNTIPDSSSAAHFLWPLSRLSSKNNSYLPTKENLAIHVILGFRGIIRVNKLHKGKSSRLPANVDFIWQYDEENSIDKQIWGCKVFTMVSCWRFTTKFKYSLCPLLFSMKQTFHQKGSKCCKKQ